MKRNRTLERLRKQVGPDSKIFIDNSFAIARRIDSLLISSGMTRKDLADKLAVTESQVSRWMSGAHNFTLKSLARIEAALGHKLLSVEAENIALADTTG